MTKVAMPTTRWRKLLPSSLLLKGGYDVSEAHQRIDNDGLFLFLQPFLDLPSPYKLLFS